MISKAQESSSQASHAADARRELEFIDAALQLLSESEYDALSVDELVRRGKASNATDVLPSLALGRRIFGSADPIDVV